MSNKDTLLLSWDDGTTSEVDLIFPDSIDDITPEEVDETPLRVGFTFNNVYCDFDSHHGKFVLQQAVMLQSHLTLYNSFLASNKTVSPPVTAQFDKLLNREVAMINTARKQWWYPEVCYLLHNYKNEVLHFQAKVRADHQDCPVFPSCDHRMWFALGRFVKGPVLQALGKK